jgi:hypothetical protein
LFPAASAFAERPFTYSFKGHLNLAEELAPMCALLEQQFPRETRDRAVAEILGVVFGQDPPFFIGTGKGTLYLITLTFKQLLELAEFPFFHGCVLLFPVRTCSDLPKSLFGDLFVLALGLHLQCPMDRRDPPSEELHVNDESGDLNYVSGIVWHRH